MSRLGLVLPATSYRGADFVDAAADLGVDLIVATEGSLPLSPGVAAVITIDCSDPRRAADTIVAAVEDAPLDAILGVDESGVVVAAMVAEALGLPHNPVGAVSATRDKAVMRGFLLAAAVPQPRFAVLAADQDPHASAAEIGYPVVVKPRTLSASRGVIRVDEAAELADAVTRVESILVEAGGSPPLLVEEYLNGEEVAVEALATPAGVEILAVFDKPDPLSGPYFEETIYVTPSRHPESVIDAVAEVLGRAVSALGLVHGPLHAEFRLTDEGPKVIEVASRSIGGLCGRSLRFGMLHQSLESLLIRAALGMPRRGMNREAAASGVMMLPIPRDGTLREVRGVSALSEVPGVTSIEITVPLGGRIRRLPEGDRYLGFLFAAADNPAEVEAALREGHSLLEFVID
jgi:biotin carboxylase